MTDLLPAGFCHMATYDATCLTGGLIAVGLDFSDHKVHETEHFKPITSNCNNQSSFTSIML